MDCLKEALNLLNEFDYQYINIDNMNEVFNLLADISNNVQEIIMKCGDKIDNDEIKTIKFNNDNNKQIEFMKDIILEKEDDKKKKKDE